MWSSSRRASLGLVLAVAFVVPAWAGVPRVTARAAIVVDARTGQTLWEDNADAQLPPASTTKVLTAILALESGRLDDWMEVSEYAASTAPSKLGLRPGQAMQLRDLLYAVLLKSANDASTVVAEGLAGSEVRFADRMTARAHALGATSSYFENAHGLSAPGHVSTARDLATLFRHGLRLPAFRDMLETPSIALPVEGGRVQTVSVRSHNRLLTGWTHQVIGKTGYTRPARRCFVGAASDNGRDIVIAILGSNDLWGDARKLVAFGLGDEELEPAPLLVAAEDDGEPVEIERPQPRARAAARAAKPTAVASAKAAAAKPATKARGTAAATARAAATAKAAATARAKAGARPKAEAGRIAAATKRRGGTRAVVEGDRDEETQVARRYAVQLGPYGKRQMLRTTRIDLARRGYVSAVAGSSLRVGEFPTRAAADKLAGRLRGSGYRPSVVALR